MSIPNIQIQDGKAVDQETGEVLAEAAEGFTVKDRESAEWVMKVIYDAENDIKALENRKAVLVKNMDDAIRHKSALLASFKWRWENELIQFAKEETKKGKTWHSPYGKVAWSKCSSRVKVKDEARAVSYAGQCFPYALEITRKFHISQLTEEDKTTLVGMLKEGNPVLGMIFELTPDSESFSINTGVK